MNRGSMRSNKASSEICKKKLGIPEFLGPGRKSWMADHGRWALDAGRWALYKSRSYLS